MLIFTGMDNSGKTTLVGKVAKDLGRPVVKSMGPNYTVDEKHIWLLDQMTRERAFPGSVIFDRFLPFEEMVYGKVLRGDPIYSLDDPYMKSLKDLNPTIVYTRPSSEVIFNFGDREQMEGVIEEKVKLLMAWDDLMWGLKARGWDIRHYDYTAENEMKDKEEDSQLEESLKQFFERLFPEALVAEGQPLEWRKGCSCNCCCEDEEEEED